MAYSQLIQFKRLEERAFIFLNGRQLMLAVFGVFSGFLLSDKLGLGGLTGWVMGGVLGVLGIALGGVYRGLYGYQYLLMIFKTWTNLGQQADPERLYERSFEAQYSYSLGAADGGALITYQPGQLNRQRVGQTGGAHIYRISPADLTQYPPQMIAGLLSRWSGFWAGARPPIRMVVHSTPFQADQVIEETRIAALTARERWRSRALSLYSRFLEDMIQRAAMYQAEHELLMWAGSETEAQATVGSMASFMGLQAEGTEMTPLLKGNYEVQVDHLKPTMPRQPCIILLVSHEFTGEWSWADPLVTILRQSFPVSIAVDVERNMSANQALRKLVQFENVVLDVLNNNKTGRDPKAEGALQDIQLAMAKANAGLSLHFTTVVVAVKGATLQEARQNVEAIRTLTAARMALVMIPGGQEELLKFFTPTKREAINLPEISHNITSDGMAVLSAPYGFRRRSSTDGVFWGVGSTGGSDSYPIFWNGFGADPDKPAAYHGLFLGKSGYGKTVSMNAMCYREALRGTQIVMMEPQGHSQKLVNLVGEGASYNPLSLRSMQINPLDPISDSLNEQKGYQISLYRLMLKQIDPHRSLTMQEAGLLDAALSMVYDGLDDPLNTAPNHVPQLEHLCHYLKTLGAKNLARDLRLNYVDGGLGEVFNRPTNLDVGLEADVVTYNFNEIPEASRSLIYTLVLGRIQRIVRVGGRMRRRIVAIDEFGWMAQEPMLNELVALWIKTFRTFGCGVWLAEQDLIRLTGGAGSGDLSGHSVIGNSVFQLFFFHESAAAEVVSTTFPNLAPYQATLETFPRPQEAGLAEAVLRIPDGAYHTYMVLAPAEAQALLGS